MMGRKRKHRTDLPRRMYHRTGTYYFVDVASKWHNLGKNLAEALIEYGRINELDVPGRTLEHIIERYQREVLPRKAPKTQREQARQLSRLRAVFGHMAPEDVQPSDIYEYMSRRPPVAGRHEKSLLSHVYAQAIRWGLAETNPCAQVRAERRKKAPARYLSDEEYQAARRDAPGPLGVAMDLALATGLRLGDVLALRRQDCIDDGIRVRVSKTGVEIVFAWDEARRAAVKAALSLRPNVDVPKWLVSTRAGDRYTSAGFGAMWQRWMRTRENRFGFHDIRRKAAKDAEVAMGREYARQLLGHSSQAMTARYVGGVFRVGPSR